MEYIDTYHTFDRKLKLICVCLNSDSFISGQQYYTPSLLKFMTPLTFYSNFDY
jgi:hypothetical protein